MRVGLSFIPFLALAPSTLAICVTDPSQYIERPANAVVGRLGGGSCVPIGAKFALTANHVGIGGNARVLIDGVYYPVLNTYPHPDAPVPDLKIIEIDGPPYFVDWTPLHPDPLSLPKGTPIVLGGTGYAYGTPDGPCVEWGERQEHWATNNLEGFLAGLYAWYRFDEELPSEGIATAFDSGSFLGVDEYGQCQLSLLAIAVSASTTGGPTCDGQTATYALIDNPWMAPFTGAICDGDLDADADTDVMDFAIFTESLLTSAQCTRRSQGDFNHDGTVDVIDFSIFIGSFGCSPDAPDADPPPPFKPYVPTPNGDNDLLTPQGPAPPRRTSEPTLPHVVPALGAG